MDNRSIGQSVIGNRQSAIGNRQYDGQSAMANCRLLHCRCTAIVAAWPLSLPGHCRLSIVHLKISRLPIINRDYPLPMCLPLQIADCRLSIDAGGHPNPSAWPAIGSAVRALGEVRTELPVSLLTAPATRDGAPDTRRSRARVS